MLEELFVALTHKTVKIPSMPEDLQAHPAFLKLCPSQNEPIPHFALPTTTMLIKALPESQFKMVRDTAKTKHRIQTLIEWQEDALRQLRASERLGVFIVVEVS